MRVYHPRDAADLAARNRLLTTALRPDEATMPIEQEYPVVLGEEGTAFSFCLGEPHAPLAHANLWPRRVIGETHAAVLAVGLVGNVATDERYRSQGLMRQLVAEIKAVASAEGLQALLLWSDLTEFYQKLGFTSCGRERRWHLRRRDLQTLRSKGPKFRALSEERPETLKRLMSQRYPVPFTLERSPEEFAQLLRIPAVTAVAAGEAYAILGKGCDMTCVVHEWGALKPELLLMAVDAAAEAAGLTEVLLLTPAKLEPQWGQCLARHACGQEVHPMALAWSERAEVAAVLEQSFIWGLDSI